MDNGVKQISTRKMTKADSFLDLAKGKQSKLQMEINILRRGASFAVENIGRPDGVFILPRWSGLDVQTDFHVNYFHQLSYCS